MIKTLVILATFALVALAVPVKEEEERTNGVNGWYIPKEDGTFYWVSKEAADELLNEDEDVDAEKIEDIDKPKSMKNIKFFLVTKDYPTVQQEITTTVASIQNSRFNASNPTRFTIHGWKGSGQDSWHFNISDAWFTHGEYNMIQVDWSKARSIDYISSVRAVPKTGKQVGDMINFLVSKFNMPLNNLQIIGHSLGAHIAGYAAKNVKGQVHTIVGCDPALPLFSYDKPNKRLNSKDAFYVESIQTNGGKLGFLKPIGRGAFYPNGGQKQPGCGIDVTGSCSHSRSYLYYATSVLYNNFPSVNCPNYSDAVAKECGATYSSTYMGADTNAYMTGGNFYVPVTKSFPFGMGPEDIVKV